MAFLQVRHPHTLANGTRLLAASTVSVGDNEVPGYLKRTSGTGIKLYSWLEKANGGVKLPDFLDALEASRTAEAPAESPQDWVKRVEAEGYAEAEARAQAQAEAQAKADAEAAAVTAAFAIPKPAPEQEETPLDPAPDALEPVQVDPDAEAKPAHKKSRGNK